MAVLPEFFAVTLTSVYHVVAEGENGHPYLEKIALRGESDVPVGEILDDGTMISVGGQLILFTFTKERDLGKVRVSMWGRSTSHVVALFLEKEDAEACFVCNTPPHMPRDERWLAKTEEVLRAIGEDHPKFSVCREPRMELIPGFVF